MTSKDKQFVLWFKDLGIEDVPLVGGKNASLGEMYGALTKKGVNIPNGFAVTAYAYRYFLKKAKIEAKIKLAKKANFVGITFWRLGGEDPQIWPTLKE